METYPGDNCDFAPGMSDPPATSSEPSDEAMRFTRQILDGDNDAAKELKVLADAAELGEIPTELVD